MPTLTLKPGREKSLLRRHPWVFSGSVACVEGHPSPGETVDLLASDGSFLARGAFSPHSQIRARIWTFNPDEQVDEAFFSRRLSAALKLRSSLPDFSKANTLRLIHAESDGLPGLVVDRYENLLVLQSLSTGTEFWKETLADLLFKMTGAAAIYERSDAEVRLLEGLPVRNGWLGKGTRTCPVTITENGLQFQVDFVAGHKTGFYLDQRLNRQHVRSLSAGKDVLDCFCYTGGFSINALAGGAQTVLSVDSSAAALELCRANAHLNHLSLERHSMLEGDVFQLLRKFRDANHSFDLIILDPPKFAPTSSAVEKASRAYKDINLLAFKLLRPGGLLCTFSCSGGVDADLFQKIIASAAQDAGVNALLLNRLNQSPDHPVALHFPEGAYLKGLVCQKVG